MCERVADSELDRLHEEMEEDHLRRRRRRRFGRRSRGRGGRGTFKLPEKFYNVRKKRHLNQVF